MNKHNIIDEVFAKVGEIIKKSDIINAGLNEYDIYSLIRQGYIERVKNGYYKLTADNSLKEEQLLSKLISKGVVCVESALYYYGYSNFVPRKWTIAIPRAFSRTVKSIQENIPVKAYYIQNDVYDIGKTTGSFNGVILPVYDRERTLCDCFKYRTKIDSEIFNKSLNAYVSDDEKNLSNLSKYAKEIGIYNKMMNVMEVLLNG